MKLHGALIRLQFLTTAALLVTGCSDELSDTQTDQAYDAATSAIAESEKIEEFESTIEELETRTGELEDRLDNANIEN